MANLVPYLVAVLLGSSTIALIWVFLKLRASSKRISRSIDPINQKVKGLKLEVSALKHSRLDRQRRLEARNTTVSEK